MGLLIHLVALGVHTLQIGKSTFAGRKLIVHCTVLTWTNGNNDGNVCKLWTWINRKVLSLRFWTDIFSCGMQTKMLNQHHRFLGVLDMNAAIRNAPTQPWPLLLVKEENVYLHIFQRRLNYVFWFYQTPALFINRKIVMLNCLSFWWEKLETLCVIICRLSR